MSLSLAFAALDWQTLALVSFGAFIGALAAGGAGFAFGTMASAIWLHGLAPLQVTALVVGCGSFLHMLLVWPIRRAIEPKKLWPYLVGGAIGIPIGVLALTRTNGTGLKISLGIFLVIYGIYALAAPRIPPVGKTGRLAEGFVGLIGGLMGGIGGYSGIAPTIWTQMRAMPKEEARGIYQPFILLAHISTLILVGALALDARTLVLMLSTLPALLAGSAAGWMIYGKLNESQFRKLLAGLLLLSGLTLVV